MSEQHMTKPDETRAFLITTAVFMPLATVTPVGAFGFVIWISQSFFP